MDPFRRRLLAGALGAVLVTPAKARAETVKRVLWLSPAAQSAGTEFLGPFLEGMAALGHVQNKTWTLDARWGENSRETLDRLAVVALAGKPDVIVTQGAGLHSARKLPGATPVVFGFSGNPVELGVAKSLARPGDRFTGVTFLAYDLVGKRVELLSEMLPKARRIAVLSNSNHVGDAEERATTLKAAAHFGLEATLHRATNAAELKAALNEIATEKAEGMIVHPDGLMVQERETIGRFSLERRIPAISGWGSIAEGGGLVTYGPVLEACYRRLAYFTDRILHGASPADLSIELPTTFELVVNQRTAKALGLTIPKSILVRADRMIG